MDISHHWRRMAKYFAYVTPALEFLSLWSFCLLVCKGYRLQQWKCWVVHLNLKAQWHTNWASFCHFSLAHVWKFEQSDHTLGSSSDSPAYTLLDFHTVLCIYSYPDIQQIGAFMERFGCFLLCFYFHHYNWPGWLYSWRFWQQWRTTEIQGSLQSFCCWWVFLNLIIESDKLYLIFWSLNILWNFF